MSTGKGNTGALDALIAKSLGDNVKLTLLDTWDTLSSNGYYEDELPKLKSKPKKLKFNPNDEATWNPESTP